MPGLIVYFGGVEWEGIQGSDRSLVTELGRRRPVVYVEPPAAVRFGRRTERSWRPVVRTVAPGVTTVRIPVTPGLHRPGLRHLARWCFHAQVARRLGSQLEGAAVICSSTEPLLKHFGQAKRRVYYATDDFVAAAPIWGVSSADLKRSRRSNLGHADTVLAVSASLADLLGEPGRDVVVLGNGCDMNRYADIESVEPAAIGPAAGPIAGVIGQLNERLDLQLLEAVHAAGLSLLLVGPRTFGDVGTAQRFERLLERENVQWVDRQPVDKLAGYLRHMAVGLTPYARTAFNRHSDPLKTLEYLSAGLPVVSTHGTPGSTAFDGNVRVEVEPDRFADAVRAVASRQRDRATVRASVAHRSWESRADALLTLLEPAGDDARAS